LAYLRSLSYVDGAKVAVAGWSYGGIQAVLGAGDTSSDYVAAVVFTPASQSWEGNPDLQRAMLDAAKAADIQFLFIQAPERLQPHSERGIGGCDRARRRDGDANHLSGVRIHRTGRP
jgi:dienelactone hydrolase